MKKVIVRFIILLFICPLSIKGQEYISRNFICGYYGGGNSYDSMQYNFGFVDRRDTGLYFSKKIKSNYDIDFSQTSTYSDSSGKPILVWQGCALLDAGTMQPIFNGDFSDTKGVNHPVWKFCLKEKWSNGEEVVREYRGTQGAFFLDRGDPHSILLVYYRCLSINITDSVHLYTATIDLSGGPGGTPAVVEKSYKPVLEHNLVPLALNAVRHANGKDWWILAPELRSNRWYSILYDGELHDPVLSKIEGWFNHSEGTISVSPDGQKIGYVCSGLKDFIILNFDRCTGDLSPYKEGSFPLLSPGNMGIVFSAFAPGGRFFYLTSKFDIFQFDLESNAFDDDWIPIATFDTAQVTEYPFFYKGYFSTIFSGNDGHLYVWSFYSLRYIHRIAFPDRHGPSVGWKQDYYRMEVHPSHFVPTLIDYNMGPLPGSPCITKTKSSQNKEFILYPNPTSDIIRTESMVNYLDNVSLKILNNIGKEVYSGKLRDLYKGIVVRSWRPGIYFIKVDNQQVAKFIKVD
ncbi:MAG: T9SS type A sorting domain-containing protein [Saprospiraceae bacterium]|nr:T9SS type A sorting domain-containing protein [Saprospiraceae bacterium]